MDKWNPDLYLRYEAERTQPSYDLVARIAAAAPASIIDIGCGPGNSTRVLRERWPLARIVGLDNSPEMITKARKAYPPGEWLLADAAAWVPSTQYSIVFSNAALQWMPDHGKIIQRLYGAVAPGGALAVQVPANQNCALFQAVRRVSARSRWSAAMAGCDQLLTYLDAGLYYDWLSDLSSQVYIWYTTYYHVMEDHQGLIEWYSSTGLRPYLERLASADEREAFQHEILEDCRPAYPEQQDGKVLFPFRRLFFIAYRG
jgi:trans-aconitate 2-methyltransferase